MTDDNTRYRSSDPFEQAPEHGAHGSDPLAELARLIGQSDPFADLAREQNAAPARAPQAYDDPPHQDHRHDDHHAGYTNGHQADHHHAEQPPYDPRYDAPYPADPAPQYADPAPHYADPAPQYATPAPLPLEPAPVSDWRTQPPFDPFGASSRAAEPPRNDYRDQAPPQRGYAAPQPQLREELPPQRAVLEFSFPPLPPAQAPRAASAYDAPSPYASAPADEETFVAPTFREPTGMPPPAMHLASDRGSSPPPLDEYYDDAPQGGRRKGLVTVAAVFMLAVCGTAAAFGYRSWVAAPSSKSAPAVIRASAEPTKVAPPPSVDPNANKITYDRFGDRGQNEKVVTREEKPVDIREATRTGSAMSQVPLPSQSAPAAAANGGVAPSALTDPKKVRTVAIRPDAPDNTLARQPMVTPPAQASAAPPARQANATSSTAPLDISNPSSPTPQQPRAPAVRQTPPPAAVRPAPAPTSANAPLSLAPENAPLPPPGTSTRASAPAPTRVASAPAPAASSNGNYLVQVSSQRSEADAQAAFRSVKSKHSGVLGEYQPVIRRADLAGKGTYYRAMVGPFSTRDQAIQLCSSLKASGGDCVVQSN